MHTLKQNFTQTFFWLNCWANFYLNYIDKFITLKVVKFAVLGINLGEKMDRNTA